MWSPGYELFDPVARPRHTHSELLFEACLAYHVADPSSPAPQLDLAESMGFLPPDPEPAKLSQVQYRAADLTYVKLQYIFPLTLAQYSEPREHP